MPLFQLTCRELVYIDRTYEIEAPDAASAKNAVKKLMGRTGTGVDEQVQVRFDILVLECERKC
jgi:hypothetical protein